MRPLFWLATVLLLASPVPALAADDLSEDFDFKPAPSDEPGGAAYTWHEALDACEEKDMTLPSSADMAKMFCHADLELKEIVPEFPQVDGGCVESGATETFSNLREKGRYWSSSRHNEGVFRYVDFFDGQIGYYGSDEKLHVRCILPGDREREGQTPFPYDINDVDEEAFRYIIDTISTLYTTAFADHGKQLIMDQQWEDQKKGAVSWLMEEYDREKKQINQIREIDLNGGLARHPMLNRDAYAMVICHEIGHHLGGAPHALGASSEGQSDYFAAAKCMKRYLKVTRYRQHQTEPLPDELEAVCTANYHASDERTACRRNILAGLTLSRWFAYTREMDQTELTRRDTRQRPTTLVHGYPSPQCRLDTFIAGALCPVDEEAPFSDDSVRTGACTREAGYEQEARPQCWFRMEDAL
ncbi:reprolysin-like metallopeptidase [Thiohalomonas denitrificans]|uniref:Metallo-peptidase family M12B Reprolysin-like n=1 Tax=Thiohalomonas denitrificans TaxID=415747 RepID=A0A1G5QN56_9GAMM|nr:hypothetical protein [Thiohalomonas denitrificans]SCZ62731.1 Metallo-peptidase family M12B Reprolysin-like [Thiohalomonas denitrificans]